MSVTASLLIIPSLFAVISANFDVKLGYCRFKCSNQCEARSDLRNIKPNIKGYYWRDFDGTIPGDAFPAFDIEAPTNPKTYIGMVYHYQSNSVYTSTIVEGLNYVYIVTDDDVIKKTEDIQILCTQSPEKLYWKNVETDTINTTAVMVDGGISSVTFNTSYVTRSSICGISYAGSVTTRHVSMNFATMDGIPRKAPASTYEFLFYINETTNVGDLINTTPKSSTFFAHRYEYSINPHSIIPNFYKKIKVGSCSLTCTNQDPNEMAKYHKGLGYYWKPLKLKSLSDALQFGKTKKGKPFYAAQSWFLSLGKDIGFSEGVEERSVGVIQPFTSIYSTFLINILSTDDKSQLNLVQSNSSVFPEMDRMNFIRGGTLLNGTKVYVGVVEDHGINLPASIRLYNNSSAAYYYNINVAEEKSTFDVLTHKG